VPAAPYSAPVPAVPGVSLRSNFVWTFAGNAVYAAGQWAVLSLLAKVGGTEMLGQYALAIAIVTPVMLLSHLNLRAVLATDMQQRHTFGDYLAVRLSVTAAALLAIGILAAVFGRTWAFAGVILLVGAGQSAENISDIYYGALQRREQMPQIGRSLMTRGVGSLAAFGAVLWMTRDLVWALVALALSRIAVLLAYDRPRGSAGENLSRSGWRAQWTVVRTALPLGIVLMLGSLNTNLPRYAIERYLGTRELGAFAAVASFITVGSTVVNALGQTATPRLARYFSQRDIPRFRQLVTRLAGLMLALGIAGVLAAAVLGKIVLRVVYRPEFVAYRGLLVAAMAAAMLVYLSGTFGYAVTSAREFRVQVPLFCAVAAASGIVSWLLVPGFGLYGAIFGLSAAAVLQLGGEAFILVRAVRSGGPAA